MKWGENGFSYTWIRLDMIIEILTQWNKQLEDVILLPIEIWNYVKSGCDSYLNTVFLYITRTFSKIFGMFLVKNVRNWKLIKVIILIT